LGIVFGMGQDISFGVDLGIHGVLSQGGFDEGICRARFCQVKWDASGDDV
jgi:hypothetical protein